MGLLEALEALVAVNKAVVFKRGYRIKLGRFLLLPRRPPEEPKR